MDFLFRKILLYVRTKIDIDQIDKNPNFNLGQALYFEKKITRSIQPEKLKNKFILRI